MRFLIIVLVGLSLLLGNRPALASTPNGNVFALYYAEAKTPAARAAVLNDALGKPHFFRYLKIESMEQGEENGSPYVVLVTSEPSSGMTVQFKVLKSISLATLKEAPPSKVGDAVAVTGVVESADPSKRLLILNPVIVRYKDRLAPKIGKELYNEVDAAGVVYSFTGGKQPVNVSRRDEDLLQYEQKIIAERGKDGWAQFLLDEIAKRDKAARAERDKLGIYRTEQAPATEAPASVPAPRQSVITDDEE